MTAFRRPFRCMAGASGLALLLAGCHLLSTMPVSQNPTTEREPIPGTPGKYSYRLAPYVFLADFEIPRQLPLFRELSELREQVYRELKLPSANTPIYVYLFEEQDRYERFMRSKYPDLPKRRAFFVAQPRRFGAADELMVFTYWDSQKIRKDLRHELTHALLHSVLKDVPLWLDEGLAEYFEVPPADAGVNPDHLRKLVYPKQGQPTPNLAHLEKLSEVQQMNPREYGEAWAWTHLMLRGDQKARAVLLAYLQELRTNGKPGPLHTRLTPVLQSAEGALSRHLLDLDRRSRDATAQH